MGHNIWNFGDIFDAIGEVHPTGQPALIHGDRVIDWPELTQRSNRLAKHLLSHGAKAGDKVSFYMRNCPEYMESFVACAKARLTHVNINYRYRDEELIYIIDNSDSTVLIYDVEYVDIVNRIRPKLTKVKIFVQIGGDSSQDWELNYNNLVSEGDPSRLDLERPGSDLMFLYTGGTTGLPKGVMWSHEIWRDANLDALRRIFGAAPETMDAHLEFAKAFGANTRQLPACPLMHGTGLFTALGSILNGGAIVTTEPKGKFDPEILWQTVEKHRVTAIAIVGDAFAQPMLNVLEHNPGKFDLSCVESITSSGVMWSMPVKQGLIKHIPQVALNDSFGASEAVGFGMSVTTAEGVFETAKFEIGQHCKVFAEDGREIEPGSDEPGYIARGGAVPLGYYKDEEKTASTFKTIDGIRYSIPGDWCTVAEDGTLTLLGRGSICINSAGEKIYPEEVEEALKAHDNVEDALVVGIPDEKWGQAVVAVVEGSEDEVDQETLRSYVKSLIAPYKAPKKVVYTTKMMRAPNGKADYKAAKDYALQALGRS